MNKEFSQMAFDFPMEVEPQAPPQKTIAAHHGNALGLSVEEQQVVHEEGRRAGVVVRIKTLKKAEPLVAAPPVAEAPAPEKKAPAPPVKEAPAPVNETPTPEPTPEPMFIQMELLPAAEPLLASGPRPEPLPEPPPTAPEPEPTPLPEPLPEPGPLPKPEPAPGPTARKEKTWPQIVEKPAPAPKTAAAEKTVPVEKPKSKRGRKSLKEVAAEADLINIPGDEILFSKQYYTMGEVAEMFRVNQSLLRFWETEFSILQPRKNKKGDRYFRPVDIKNLHLIYHLLRQRKYTIEGAKEFLRKNKTANQRFEAIQRLEQIKAFLLELKAQL